MSAIGALLEALREGGPGLRYRLADGQAAFVVRHAGSLYAWVNRCPHRGTELDWEKAQFFDDDGRFLVCASHGAVFDPCSGRCVEGPCRGLALQPAPLPTSLDAVP